MDRVIKRALMTVLVANQTVGTSEVTQNSGAKHSYSGAHWVSSPAAIIIAALCSTIGVCLSVWNMISHCRNYNESGTQKYIVRILAIVPLYGLVSWLSLVITATTHTHSDHGSKIQRRSDGPLYLEITRDCYESFVVYCFLTLILVGYCRGEARALMLLGQHPQPLSHPWPMKYCLKPIKLNIIFLRRCRQLCIQFILIKPVCAFISLSLIVSGHYHGNQAWEYTLLVVYNTSYTLALYALLLFYMALKNDIQAYSPVTKFFAVKVVVFATYWQNLCVSFAPGMSALEAEMWNDWILCVEMSVFALIHYLAFPWHEFTLYHLSQIERRKKAGLTNSQVTLMSSFFNLRKVAFGFSLAGSDLLTSKHGSYKRKSKHLSGNSMMGISMLGSQDRHSGMDSALSPAEILESAKGSSLSLGFEEEEEDEDDDEMEEKHPHHSSQQGTSEMDDSGLVSNFTSMAQLRKQQQNTSKRKKTVGMDNNNSPLKGPAQVSEEFIGFGSLADENAAFDSVSEAPGDFVLGESIDREEMEDEDDHHPMEEDTESRKEEMIHNTSIWSALKSVMSFRDVASDVYHNVMPAYQTYVLQDSQTGRGRVVRTKTFVIGNIDRHHADEEASSIRRSYHRRRRSSQISHSSQSRGTSSRPRRRSSWMEDQSPVLSPVESSDAQKKRDTMPTQMDHLNADDSNADLIQGIRPSEDSYLRSGPDDGDEHQDSEEEEGDHSVKREDEYEFGEMQEGTDDDDGSEEQE